MKRRFASIVAVLLAVSTLAHSQSANEQPQPQRRLRWSVGAPNSFEVGAPKRPLRAVKGQDVEVGVLLEDTGKKLRVLLVVVNLGTKPMRLDPATFTLDATRPEARNLTYVAPPDTLQPHVPKPLSPVAPGGSGMPPRLDPGSNRFEVLEQRRPQTEVPVPGPRPELLEMMSTALWPGMVHPGRAVRGAVYFKGYKRFQAGVFRARIGKYDVEIPLERPVKVD